jgi:hypothetical protein
VPTSFMNISSIYLRSYCIEGMGSGRDKRKKLKGHVPGGGNLDHSRANLSESQACMLKTALSEQHYM